jgi:hypothetical protein
MGMIMGSHNLIVGFNWNNSGIRIGYNTSWSDITILIGYNIHI